MAEKETKEVKVKSDRQLRWEKHVENYIKESPVKGQAKKARGEFDTIPDTFK
jgi:hypothetical protein